MKIIYNVEIILIIINICVVLTKTYSNGHRDSDICSHWNGRRHFLELGERGELHAFNVTAPLYRNAMYSSYNNINSNRTTISDIWYQCKLELVTCAECVIRITFTYTNFSKICTNPSNAAGKIRSRCSCEHILFSEPPYDTEISGDYFCGDGKVFRSRTRTLLLKFMYRATHKHIFSLQYYSERNVKIISGSPKQSIVNNNTQTPPQIISTPYFPLAYPRDYGIEHILTCEAENCHVRLEFTDFQLGLTSSMSIFDSNGQMVDSYTGIHFRPPIIVSSGKSLLLTFRGNGAAGLGYRAEISFISSKQLNQIETVPYTDCGGMVEGTGGAITMMNMIENNTEIRFYDCIWIIKPLNNYMMMKTHISLRVDALYGMASRSELIIRQGTTSVAPDIEKVTWPNNGLSNKNHLIPIINGFYIRLKGVFGLSSRLAIVYSVFNYMNCYIGSEFLCQNNHCISIRLHCDGFDHCGDNSDEPDTCEDEWAHMNGDRRWYTHKPNYYFPKIEQYPDFKTASGVFVMSTVGILLILSGWMILLYRMGVRARNQRELQNHLQTISELLDRQEEIPIDDPPDYEAPPDYDEVIKIGMNNEMNTPHRRRHRNTGGHEHENGHNHGHGGHERSGGRGHGKRHRTGHSSRSRSRERPLNCNHLSVASPSSVLEIRRQTENIQEIANRVLSATGMCEISETSTASSTKQNKSNNTRNNNHQKTLSTASSNSNSSSSSPISPSSELSDALQLQQQQNSSNCVGTPSTCEENSSEFKDGSFQVSLSLALSQTPLTESTNNNQKQQFPPHSNFTETHARKKSWVCFHSDSTPTERKLRHTSSTPETFLTDDILNREMNYGSYLTTERNSLLSNASTFGSDLPSDDGSVEPSSNGDSMQLNSMNDDDDDNDELIKLNNKQQHQQQQQQQQREQHEKIDLERNEDNTSTADISCFGNVNLFGGNKRQTGNQGNKKQNPSSSTTLSSRRNRRSKSLNQNDNNRRTRLKRCSSADLLLPSTSFRRES